MKKRLSFAIGVIAFLFVIYIYNSGRPEASAEASVSSEPAISTNTPKPSEISPTLRFIAMADSRGLDKGVNSSIVKKTFEQIKKLSQQPQFAVLTGDLVDGANNFDTVKKQLEYFKKISTTYYPESFFYPGIGNHETRSSSGGEKAFGEVFPNINAHFLNGYNKSVYYFDAGNTRFFMLNSDHPGEIHTVSDKQLNWLKLNIDKSKTHNIFFVHEPPYPDGPNSGSSLDVNRLQRDKFWQIIDSSNKPMVFCGHDHFYSRRHINSDFNEKVKGISFNYKKSIFQITAGTFGAPIYTQQTDKKDVDVPPVSQYHYAVVDISGIKISVKVYNLDGKVIDSFEQ